MRQIDGFRKRIDPSLDPLTTLVVERRQIERQGDFGCRNPKYGPVDGIDLCVFRRLGTSRHHRIVKSPQFFETRRRKRVIDGVGISTRYKRRFCTTFHIFCNLIRFFPKSRNFIQLLTAWLDAYFGQCHCRLCLECTQLSIAERGIADVDKRRIGKRYRHDTRQTSAINARIRSRRRSIF